LVAPPMVSSTHVGSIISQSSRSISNRLSTSWSTENQRRVSQTCTSCRPMLLLLWACADPCIRAWGHDMDIRRRGRAGSLQVPSWSRRSAVGVERITQGSGPNRTSKLMIARTRCRAAASPLVCPSSRIRRLVRRRSGLGGHRGRSVRGGRGGGLRWCGMRVGGWYRWHTECGAGGWRRWWRGGRRRTACPRAAQPWRDRQG
jgi:hypothetical protein